MNVVHSSQGTTSLTARDDICRSLTIKVGQQANGYWCAEVTVRIHGEHGYIAERSNGAFHTRIEALHWAHIAAEAMEIGRV